MKFHLVRLLFFISTPLILSSQDISWGLRVGPLMPLSGTSSNTIAGTHKSRFHGGWIGAHLGYQVSPRDEVRLTLNSAGLAGELHPINTTIDIRNEYQFFSTGVEWNHNFGSRFQGWNVFGGLSQTQMSRDFTVMEPSPFGGRWGSTSRFSQHKRLGLNIGGGYQILRWFEVTASWQRVSLNDRQGGPEGLSRADWFQLGAVFHFGRE